jgi:N-acetylmuramoyl-L-alanine amidase
MKSDYIRFPGIGFSVLRRSPEPAVLVECGYVNDDGDAKCLEDPAAQEQIATAIVAGLKDYAANQ